MRTAPTRRLRGRARLGLALGHALRAVSTLALRRRRAAAAVAGPADDPASEGFRVLTFVTDEREYAAMRASFEGAGFDDERAAFERLDDGRTGGEPDDPFAAIARIARSRDGRVAILCHQDVRLDRGAGADRLRDELAALTARDPSWAVVGSAGVTPAMRIVRRVADPHGGDTRDALPVRAVSLDESFLVFNPARRPSTTPGLRGFHLYGTDVVLRAHLDGAAAYVIDFPLTHLSGGSVGGDYAGALEAFVAAWNPRFAFVYLRTLNSLVLLSRFASLRRLGSRPRVLAHVAAAAPKPVLAPAPARTEARPPAGS